MKFKWKGEYLVIKYTYYENRRIALMAFDESGELYTKISINVPDEKLNENEVVVKNYSENEGIFNAIKNLDGITRTKRTANFGNVVNQPIILVDLEKIEKM